MHTMSKSRVSSTLLKDVITYKKASVSAIVPAFDEEKNIAKTIKFLLEDSLINEVICVNDGSTDSSFEIINSFKNKIKTINLKENHGKGKALSEGIKKAKGEIVLFIDADLINFTHKHVKMILSPLLKGEKKVVLGYGTPKKNHFFASSSLVKGNTGQRAYFRQDLLPYLGKIAKKKYGVEVYLNTLFNKNDVKMIPLVKMTHIWKHKKHPPQKAIKQYIKMGTEIAKEVGKREFREMTEIEKIRIKKLRETIRDEFNTVIANQSYFMPYFSKIHLYSKRVFNYLFES